MVKQKSYVMMMVDISEIRKILRKNIPQINKLESLAELKNLKLKRIDAKERIVMLFYEGLASQELYHNISEKLIEKEVIRKNNLVSSWIGNSRQYNEHKGVHIDLDFSGYSILVFLKTYNPNYE